MTPDIEWEKVVEEFYLNFTDIEKQELDTPSWNHNGVTPYLVEQWIRTLLTSRDTYWKERVLAIIEEHDPSSDRDANPRYWGKTLREAIKSLR